MTGRHTGVFQLLYQLGQLILLTLKPCEEEDGGEEEEEEEEGEERGDAAPRQTHTQGQGPTHNSHWFMCEWQQGDLKHLDGFGMCDTEMDLIEIMKRKNQLE